ncbi:HigA family addiction module antitoxin [Bacteroides ihuae]|uniref:HigA family addiction module antitoxin n=1 Tax=Bacteroides ihuae TaxID=1852362 RepID=UPI0008D94617|nr:HigA family addiction module antitoxin [Bacteroides ihuae]
MGTSANNLQSFRPYHPGELVKEELECRNIKQKDFARKFELSYTALNEILNSKRPITTEFALLLEAALGINADLLVKMQTEYNLQIARKNNTIIEKINKIKQIAAIF